VSARPPIGVEYSPTPYQRSHSPPQRTGEDYLAYRPCLRLESSFRCIYCLAHESEVAKGREFGGFEVEHFRPKESFGWLRTSFSNLFWCCPECNRAKGDKWPNATEVAEGFRFLDPTLEAYGPHLQIVGELVVWASDAGEFTKDEVNLNSPVHQERRRDRAKRAKRIAALELLIAGAWARQPLPGSFSASEIATIQTELDQIYATFARPTDTPTQCFCAGKVPRRLPRVRTRRARKAANAALVKGKPKSP